MRDGFLLQHGQRESCPDTPEDEGLSYVVVDEEGKDRVLLRDVVELLGAEIIGRSLLGANITDGQCFPSFLIMLSSPHHIHHRTEHAARVGAAGKRELNEFFPFSDE